MKHRSKSIWQIVDTQRPGGIETHILELSAGLKKAGWYVMVIFIKDYGRHPLKEQLDAENIPYTCLNGHIKALWDLLKTQRPHLLHTHGYKAGLFGRFCGLLNQTPVVSTYHAGEKTTGKLAFYTMLDRLTAPLCTAISVSEKIARRLPTGALFLNNFVSIPPRPQFKKENSTSLNIAFVGRLSHEKGPDIFCQLAQQNIQKTTKNNRLFHLYGDGPMRKDLEKTYGQYVTFHGQSEMKSCWPNIDLLIMPSRFEGLPMAALEAMAHEIPVIASEVGALPQLIQNEKTGWIAPVEALHLFNQHVNTWAQKDAKSRQMMGRHARTHIIAHYSPEVIIPKIEEIYNTHLTSSLTEMMI